MDVDSLDAAVLLGPDPMRDFGPEFSRQIHGSDVLDEETQASFLSHKCSFDFF
jgi:hypothetical protein